MKVLACIAGAFLFFLLFFSVSWFFYGVLIAGGLALLLGGIYSTVENLRGDQHRKAAEREAAKRAAWH